MNNKCQKAACRLFGIYYSYHMVNNHSEGNPKDFQADG